MKPYHQPVLRDLGAMTSITRKSGNNFDFTDFTPQSFDNGNPGPAPPGWPPILCWPPGIPTIFCG